MVEKWSEPIRDRTLDSDPDVMRFINGGIASRVGIAYFTSLSFRLLYF